MDYVFKFFIVMMGIIDLSESHISDCNVSSAPLLLLLLLIKYTVFIHYIDIFDLFLVFFFRLANNPITAVTNPCLERQTRVWRWYK